MAWLLKIPDSWYLRGPSKSKEGKKMKYDEAPMIAVA